MARASLDDTISLTAKHSGYTQEVVRDVLESYGIVIWKLLVNGFVCRMPLLGEWSLKDYDEQPPRPWTDPRTGEKTMLESQPAHQRPKFKFAKKLRQEIKTHSEGNLR